MPLTADPTLTTGEHLRLAMRHWVTGIAIATSRFERYTHGMTVNSFVSIALDPPLVTVTMAHNTRTYELVKQSGVFAITILSREQQVIAELFAGRIPDHGDRMEGLDTFQMKTGAPLIRGGVAFIDCRVVHQYEMPRATLLVGEVLAASSEEEVHPPLAYYNRDFRALANNE